MNKGTVSISSNKVDVQFDRGRDWRAGVIEGEMFKLAPPV